MPPSGTSSVWTTFGNRQPALANAGVAAGWPPQPARMDVCTSASPSPNLSPNGNPGAATNGAHTDHYRSTTTTNESRTMQRIIADLVVQDPADKEVQLTLAVGAAIHAAKVDKACGVLLTRHDYASFTVALSPKVPYGQTYELDLCLIQG